MTELSLHCGMCKRDYNNPNDWIRHLVERKHQISSCHVATITNFWGNPLKPTILVATANFRFVPEGGHVTGIPNGLKLLNYVGRESGVLVGDFVCSVKRPKTAFLRFASEVLVNKVMGKCSKIEVGNEWVTLQRATEFSSDQWNGLMDALLSAIVSPNDILSLT